MDRWMLQKEGGEHTFLWFCFSQPHCKNCCRVKFTVEIECSQCMNVKVAEAGEKVFLDGVL